MQKVLFAAVIAALGPMNADAADWTRFLGSHPDFPTQLADRGLAVDAGGQVAVQTYNRLAWSGQIEFTHEYTLAADGTIPWIWGLVGRGGSVAIEPRGVDQRDGYRLVWIERADDPLVRTDQLSVVAPNGSQPNWWLSEPQVGGRVVAAVSGGDDGAFALRILDAGAGLELVAFNSPFATWRVTTQPCPPGIQAANLAVDYAPADIGSPFPMLSVAGSCDDGVAPPQVFVQRFDVLDGGHAAPERVFPNPGNALAQLAFSPAHEVIAVYDTPWPHKEVHRVGPPGSPFAVPPEPLHGIDQITALVAGSDSLAIVGTNVAGEPVVASVMPSAPIASPQILAGLAGFAGGPWTIAAGRDGTLLAMRTETDVVTSLVRLVGLDTYGTFEWTAVIDGTLPGSLPQAVPVNHPGGGFVVAVDRIDATGTLGVHVQRVGSSP